MSEPSKKPRKKKLPENITELPDKEVAKHLFGKPAAKELEKVTDGAKSKSDHSGKK